MQTLFWLLAEMTSSGILLLSFFATSCGKTQETEFAKLNIRSMRGESYQS